MLILHVLLSLCFRLYTTLLSFLQYCRGVANREVPSSVMKVLLPEDGGSDEAADVERIEREQNELMQGNYAVLRNEATALVDVVSKDALHGSEVMGRGFLILRLCGLGLQMGRLTCHG